MDNKVYVIKCPDYAQAGEKVHELLDMMGGMNGFVEPGEKIVLKVNLLRKAPPDEAVSTHPAVVAEVARMTKAAGGKALIADSPGAGFRFTEKVLQGIYEETGMVQAAKDSGAELNSDFTFEPVSFSEGDLVKRFEVISAVLKADGVLNLCKLKTHSFMLMTGAVKNNFGVIPGLSKPGYHAKLMDTGRFAGMLLDLSRLVAPRLSIMDAVVGMEGDGPGTGDPRRIGLLLGSTSPLALDVVAGEIIGLPREKNPILLEAEKRGLSPCRLGEVALVGGDLDALRIPDYKFPPTIYTGTGMAGHLTWWQKLMAPLFKDGLTLKPHVSKKKCVACAACYEACPMGAITMEKGHEKAYARIDDDKCIRCYCCHEMCAEEAIRLKGSFMYRLMNA